MMLFVFTACDDTNVHDHNYVDTVKDGKAIKVCTICGEEAASTFSVVSKAEDFAALAEDVKGVVLADDLTLTKTIVLERDLIIALNGKTITGDKRSVFYVNAGNVELIGKGIITVTEGIADNNSVIFVGDDSGEERDVSFKMGKDVVIKSDYSYGLSIFGKMTNETVVIDGDIYTKVSAAVSGNGTDTKTPTNITINGNLTTEDEYCIYHPQAGEILINGKIVGKGGIELKGGTLKLGDNSLIKATATAQTHTPSSNGTSTSGYAIAIVMNADYVGNVQYIQNNKATVEGIVLTLQDKKE